MTNKGAQQLVCWVSGTNYKAFFGQDQEFVILILALLSISSSLFLSRAPQGLKLPHPAHLSKESRLLQESSGATFRASQLPRCAWGRCSALFWLVSCPVSQGTPKKRVG